MVSELSDRPSLEEFQRLLDEAVLEWVRTGQVQIYEAKDADEFLYILQMYRDYGAPCMLRELENLTKVQLVLDHLIVEYTRREQPIN